MSNGKTIPVLDVKNGFLSFTHPAKARKLVKDGKATVFNNDPFVIKLTGDGSNTMERAFINFTDFFKEERDVWIQHVSGTKQTSMEFQTVSGQVIPYLLPKGRKPHNLSQRVPFGAIKNSMQLRDLLNRRPKVIQLMTSEEATKYYQDRADRNKTTLDEELEAAFTIQRNLQDKDADTTDKAPDRKTLEEQAQLVEEVGDQIYPRVIGLCQEAKKDPEGKDLKRLKAEDFIDELHDLEGLLSAEDFSYIASHAPYKTVKAWANSRLAKLDPTEEE